MAAGYDGSIKILTKIDQAGFNTGRKQLESGLNSIKSSLKNLAAVAGIAFGAAALINFGKDSVEAAKKFKNAMIGLQSVVEGQGKSYSDAQKYLSSYISDGLVPAAEAATAYKNLIMRGYSEDQVTKVMTALKDSAAFGRQASLTMGEAVRSATEGLKNENSILVDNAGVTKNVSMMWKDYANSIGVGVDSLTKQQKIQAEVNGILQETRFQTGDAAKMTKTFSGEVAALEYNFNNLKIAIGNAIIPIAQAVLPAINTIIKGLTTVANLFAQVSAAFFGTQVQQQDAITASASNAASAELDLADATKEAAKAAKNSLASFDELNIIQSETTSSSGGSSGGSGSSGSSGGSSSGGSEESVQLPGSVLRMIEGLKAALNPELWLDPSIQLDVEGTLSKLSGSLSNLQRAAEKLFGHTDFDFVVPALLKLSWNLPANTLSSLGTFISGQLDIFSGVVLGEFDTTWDGIGNSIAGIIKGPTGFAAVVNDAFKDAAPGAQVAIGQALMSLNPLLAGTIFADTFGKAVYGESYSRGLQAMNAFFKPLSEQLDNLYEGIGATTANAVQPFLASFDDVDKKFKTLGWSKTVVRETDTITHSVDSLSKSVISSLTKSKEKSLEQIQLLWNQGLITTEEEKEKMIDSVNKLYESQIATTQSGNTRIAEILTIAKNENRAIKEEELAEINAIMGQMKDDGVRTMSSTEEEYKKIMDRMSLNAEAMSAAQAGSIIKNANKTRDDSIKAAEDTYLNVVASIRKQREQGIITSDEQAEAMIANAKQQYNESVDYANKTRDEVVNAAMKQAGEHASWVDRETGDTLSGWDRFWKGIGQGLSDFWNNTIAPWFTAEKWKSLGQGLKDGLGHAFKNALNAVIDIFNGFINWLNEKLHIKWDAVSIFGQEVVPAVDYQLFKISHIPKLATGAVIPPNNKFLAILGDQKQGNNIETPESLLRKVVREESGKNKKSVYTGDLVIQVEGGQTIGRIAIQTIIDYFEQNGQLPFPV